ncbi:hypothetical protein B0H10DRAFT_2041762 [Mycena sp. CBHHK59/15]|nr:hypothetical protein B0H10DRAFT_2041762 [Mycena sp. CBHHK59/15]
MLNVPHISSVLATVIIETFFFGIYLVLFLTSIYLLLTLKERGFQREGSIWRSPILCGGTTLFITVTGHWILTVDRLFLAFVKSDSGADPLGFYSDFSQVTEVLQSGFLLASLATVDAQLVHRLWTVWAHDKYVMIFPVITLLGLLVCSIGITYDFSRFLPGDSWIVADCALPYCECCTLLTHTNMYCTAMISWRLWATSKMIKPVGGRTLMSVIVIMVESAALCASWAIFFIIAYATQSNLRFLIDVTPAIIGSANMLIYVRVGLGWAHSPTPIPATPLKFPPTKFMVNRDLSSDIKAADLAHVV